MNIGEQLDEHIRNIVKQLLDKNKKVELPEDLIETDNLGEVIEKLCILHCRMWYLEDSYKTTDNDAVLADVKRKIDICFKQKRPKYVQAINRMVDSAIVNGRSLVEDSVKHYKGFN